MPRALILSLILLLFAPLARAQDGPPQGEPEVVAQPELSTEPELTADNDSQDPSTEPAPLTLLDGLNAKAIGTSLQHSQYGSLDPADAMPMEIHFSRYGSGIESLKLSAHYNSVSLKEHVQIQAIEANDTSAFVPFALEAIIINGHRVPLLGVAEIQPDGTMSERMMWEELAPGRFRALVVNHADVPIVEIERAFVMTSGSRTLEVSQSVRNLTDQPLSTTLVTYGPGDVARLSNYSGDRRRVRFGYIQDPSVDPTQTVRADDKLARRDSLRGKRDVKRANTDIYAPVRAYWPIAQAQKENWKLSWFAFSNRYFAVAVRPITGSTELPVAKAIDRILLNKIDSRGKALRNSPMGLRMTSEEVPLAPGADASLDFAVYLGPLSKPAINAETGAAALAMEDLVVYNFGGPCALCTFTWLTAPLSALLNFLHTYVVFDWALSIMMLVVIVRTTLHPITKWSQIRMQRFGKQMQGMAPKQKALQERYGDDRKKLQQEMARLWREEGVSPTGMLGCLPMLLQSPIWIALYASLFYNFALRHEPAFFGLFQNFGGWAFLSDLSEPDQFILLSSSGFTIPIIGGIMGPIKSLNILPLLLGAVFYTHQKYMTPPASASMTPEQEQQQKIIRVMMVVMFPVIMYNAPSGLAMYFITNSTLGILESRWVRAHMEKHDLLNVDKYKEIRKKKPTLLQRLQKRIEARQRAKMMAKMEEDIPKKGMRQHSQKTKSPDSGYKKR